MSAITNPREGQVILPGVKLTVLVENTTTRSDLVAEHGLSVWVEAGDKRVLWDTGQGAAISANSDRLGIRIQDANAVALSHGHYDHTGGLHILLNSGWHGEVYLHPDALCDRFVKRSPRESRSIGISNCSDELMSRLSSCATWTTTPTEIAPGVCVTGEIPRANEVEDVGGPFFIDRSGANCDELMDDQALFLEIPDGIVVVLGCAHAGVANTLDYVGQLTGAERIYAVLGGLHLSDASDDRIQMTLDVFNKFQIEKIIVGHCTGTRAIEALRGVFGRRVFPCSTGTVYQFGKRGHDV